MPSHFCFFEIRCLQHCQLLVFTMDDPFDDNFEILDSGFADFTNDVNAGASASGFTPLLPPPPS